MANQPNFQFCDNEEDEVRSFRHQFSILKDGKPLECGTCSTRLNKNEHFSAHWLRKESQEAAFRVEMDELTQNIFDNVERRNTESFFLRDNTRSDNGTIQFLNYSYTKSVPEMLSGLFQKATKLQFHLTYFLEIHSKRFRIESSTIRVMNPYDIEETVAATHKLMIKKIDNYLSLTNESLMQGSINSLRILVTRTLRENDVARENLIGLPLELQDYILHAKDFTITTTAEELLAFEDAYTANYTQGVCFKPPTIPMDLYCIQQCLETKELFLAPYHISKPAESGAAVKSFIIINDMTGKFHRLQEIPNPQTCHEMPVLPVATDTNNTCAECGETFETRKASLLHSQLNCGRDFSVYLIPRDILEVYARSIYLFRNARNHIWYGMTGAHTYTLRLGELSPEQRRRLFEELHVIQQMQRLVNVEEPEELSTRDQMRNRG